jgi:nitrogen fixation protein FixH
MVSNIHWKEDFSNPWFLSVLALIVTALGATISMIMIAYSASPDLVNKDYYEKGKNYFKAEARRQQDGKPLWRLNLMPPKHPVVAKAQLYRLFVINPDGKPVREGKSELFVYRPNDVARDFQISMKQVDVGTFLAEITFPLPGNWDLIGQIEHDGQSFNVAQRIFVND